MQGKTIFITGGAGYVGEMLCDQFAKRADVEKIIALDKEPQTEYGKNIPKVVYLERNLGTDGWQEEVGKYEPDTVIHTAWQIRALYGESQKQWQWNIEGSNKVFDFALSYPSVKKLIYFSTASSYSARPENTFSHYFTEAEGLRDDEYIYAKEKKVTEENLKQKFEQAKRSGKSLPQVTVVRPAAITGPRGRYMRIRFGLQSALSGNLKGGLVNKLVTTLTSFVPAPSGWVRQFIHEDDVSDIIEKLTFENFDWDYNVFNITPTGEAVYALDMAEAVGKKVLPIRPWMARIAFWFFWHLTRGRIPTCPGSWRFYSYPLLMSGEKLKQIYECQFSSKDAFRYTNGRYENWVPEAARSTKRS